MGGESLLLLLAANAAADAELAPVGVDLLWAWICSADDWKPPPPLAYERLPPLLALLLLP